MRYFVVSAIVVLFSLPAFANEGSNCNGKNNCSTNTENKGGKGGDASAAALALGGKAKQDQLQGQLQGQIGVNTNEVNAVTTDLNTVEGLNAQGQDQTAVGKVDSHDSLIFETSEIPVNTAAQVLAGSCAQGASLQLGQTGASIGSGNPVCDFAAVAGLYLAAGDRTTALAVAGEARAAAQHRARVSKWRSFLTLGLF